MWVARVLLFSRLVIFDSRNHEFEYRLQTMRLEAISSDPITTLCDKQLMGRNPQNLDLWITAAVALIYLAQPSISGF